MPLKPDVSSKDSETVLRFKIGWWEVGFFALLTDRQTDGQTDRDLDHNKNHNKKE